MKCLLLIVGLVLGVLLGVTLERTFQPPPLQVMEVGGSFVLVDGREVKALIPPQGWVRFYPLPDHFVPTSNRAGREPVTENKKEKGRDLSFLDHAPLVDEQTRVFKASEVTLEEPRVLIPVDEESGLVEPWVNDPIVNEVDMDQWESYEDATPGLERVTP
jgi:hypothetical protein